MKNKFIFKIIIFILIILFIFSCDVLTKMNESEWNKKNLEEDKEDMFFVYVAGTRNIGNDDFFTLKFDEMGRDYWLRSADYLGLGGIDHAYGIATSDSGNIYVAGSVNNEQDFYIIEYDNNGVFLNDGYNNIVANERYLGITCDPSNYVFATGTDTNNFYTLKFDSNLSFIGPPAIYNAGGVDQAFGIAYNNNNIYVVGQSTIASLDFAIVKYNAGTLAQVDIRYYPLISDGFSHYVTDIAIDNYGNIYVLGHVDLGGNYDCILLKYDPSLNLIWEKTINIDVDDKGEGVAVDSAGNIYCAIHSGTGVAGSYDCYTISYDQLGIERWSRQYGTAGIDDQLWDVAVDPKGSVYVVGNSNNNFLIIKYGFYGDQRWVRNFDLGGNDLARAVAVGNK